MSFDTRRLPVTYQGDVQRFVEICKDLLGDNVLSIILFGSVARGNYKDSSDLDFCIVVVRYPQQDWKVGGEIKHRCLMSGFSSPVEPVFLDRNDLTIASPLLYEVSQVGLLVYGEDTLTQMKDVSRNIRPILRDGEKIGWRSGED